MSPRWDHFYAGGLHPGFGDPPPSSLCQAPWGPAPAPAQLPFSFCQRHFAISSCWYSFAKANPSGDLHILSISFSAVPTTDLFGVFLLPSSGTVQKKKNTFQRHHLCSWSVPVKIKRAWVDFQLLRQKINKCNERTCRGRRNFRSKDRSCLLRAKKTRQKEIFLVLNVFFLSFFSWSVLLFQPQAIR